MGLVADRIRRAVIIDDSRTSQVILETAIHSWPGFKVVGVANDASSGLELVKSLSPDLVTIHLAMPYIEGSALLTLMSGMKRMCKLVLSEQAASNVFMSTKLEALGATLCLCKRELTDRPQAFLKKVIKACDELDRLEAERQPVDLTSEAHRRSGVRRPRPAAHFGMPVPIDEDDRLRALHSKQLANAARERHFDLVTRHVAEETGFPVCLLTFIDEDTQWIKSSFGFAAESTSRADAFCNHTISTGELFIVQNAQTDPRFANNPFVVGEPGFRTYAGQPVISRDGIRLGSLCVLDTKVRTVAPQVPRRLKVFADIIGSMIDGRYAIAA